ncbi:MAG: hypothetical protein UX13_C0003G0011 [Candidatus Woesebacteria bacterium GW2011_GWB1_45_5]|uniref:HNH nuclease domain-containing protein n=1 Tax=Candidatus Woesebacteria bacterium GW2011_GWB1_45_5 TaxID=1618581 RepID=A0A0G1MRH5_9BACT|nr:MAG: hypothetical protein UX13_C0003G0011 [Candidatus Woesebacteria bacterium GW2011_GWB1_45_5]
MKKGHGKFCSMPCFGLNKRITPNVSKEELVRLYEAERIPIQAIAKKLGYGWKPIYRKMKEFGINTKFGVWRRTTTYETCWRSEETRERTFRHILNAEAKYGRRLIKGEIVHHIDGNRQNNKKENLSILTRTNHAKHHNQLDKIAYRLIEKGMVIYTDENGYTISTKLEEVLDAK